MKNWIIGAILVIAAVAAYYFFTVYEPASQEAVTTPPVVLEPVEETTLPESTEAEDIPEPVIQAAEPVETEEVPLPMLGESDPVVLESLDGLMGPSSVSEIVVGDNVISRVVATIDMLGSRQIPGVVQAVEGPQGAFTVTVNDNPETVITNEEGDPIPQYVIDPSNYGRYTPYVDMLEAADTAELVASYRSYYPLLQEAYRQMGYTDREFEARLVEIIDSLLETPEISDPVNLVKPEAVFLFTDPDLESLSAGQKILLRMGAENAARVKVKLREIRNSL